MYRVILRFREKYTVSEMCKFFKVSRSGYYDWLKRTSKTDKDEHLKRLIQDCQKENNKVYGYRRVKMWLLKKYGLISNHKAVLRIMNKFNLLSEVRRRRKYIRYSNAIHRYENIFNRDFKADKPNQKWVTDITYINTKQGVAYLSVIKDLFDGYIVSYKLEPEHSLGLVTNTIKEAIRKESVADGLALHSDQGFQYTSHAYFNLTREYGITPSMSRRGNCLDNASMENFFGHLKSECIYRTKIKTFAEARQLIDEYIYYYNYQRIQLKTKLTPYEKRCQFA